MVFLKIMPFRNSDEEYYPWQAVDRKPFEFNTTARAHAFGLGLARRNDRKLLMTHLRSTI